MIYDIRDNPSRWKDEDCHDDTNRLANHNWAGLTVVQTIVARGKLFALTVAQEVQIAQQDDCNRLDDAPKATMTPKELADMAVSVAKEFELDLGYILVAEDPFHQEALGFIDIPELN